MIKSSPLRVALGADGVSIWSSELFGDAERSRVREFLSRAFAVNEVEGVELRRAKSFGRIRYAAMANPAQLWKKLSRALSLPDDSPEASPPIPSLTGGPARRIDAGLVYLEGPGESPVRVSRIGHVLSTWRVRHQSDNTLRLWHPVLRNRRDLVFRLEEELASVLGVEEFRASALTAGVSIRFDSSSTTAERVARELEKAWPRLLEGLDGPPSQKRLFAAVGLVGLAFTGQYLAPAVRPVALAGMTLYSFPNFVNAAKQLSRGEIGISALYSTGVAFMLISGSPVAASLMATLMQLWPHLARRKIVSSQRRLFAAQRRRPTWARVVHAEGVEVQVEVDDLHHGDVIVVRAGEIVPVDGVVEDGSFALVGEARFGATHFEDKARGDAVAAGALLRDGSLTIRVERAGTQTSASYVASLLPHGTLSRLPASLEAERIANRNAKPAIALAALNLLLTRNLRRSQGVIRPDYATAPRLSAQLSALRSVAHGLERGVVFRNPAALDRLTFADVFLIDDTARLDRQVLEVATVESVNGVSAALVIGYAAAALKNSGTEQSRALAAVASKRKLLHPQPGSVRRSAGVTRYRDRRGSAIEVATPDYLAASKLDIPPQFQTPLAWRAERTGHGAASDVGNEAPSLRPLWVLRDGNVIGVVSFARTGELVGRQVVAQLQAQNDRARIIYISHTGQGETDDRARRLGIEFSQGGLSPAEKADFIRGLGRATLWIGDGSQPDARDSIAASSVSVSVAPLSRSREDAADILLPQAELSAVLEVILIGRAHRARLARDYRTVYKVNLLGVAGAFIANFNGLHSGLLSNVGTALIYARHAKALDRLAYAAEKKRARLKNSPAR